jgi:superfamily I DNA/RNA helicase/mRNA-degrading endonuclease RelE of RelBE toxin-antitoxin system
MTFTLTFKPDFMKDFIRFGRSDQTRISSYISEIEKNPNIPKGDTIKKLKYTDNLWRYRFKDCRIVYAVFPTRKVVVLLVIGQRDKVYDRLNYNPQTPNMAGFSKVLEDVLNPDVEAPPTWSDFNRPEIVEETPLSYIFSKKQLSDWDIPEEYIPALMECRTEEALENCDIPEMYILKIIDLMSPAARIEDIVQQPTRVIDRVDSLLDYSSGELGILDFLLFLDEDQERMVDWALKGPTLVKGGAGSGKSTVALYRARALCEGAMQQFIKPRILFTTYTNSLVRASEQLLNHLIGDSGAEVKVSTIDKIAWKIVYDKDGWQNSADDNLILEAIRASKFSLEASGDNELAKFLTKTLIEKLGDDYLKDEFQWVIQGRGITTLDEYLKADRTGRSYGFNENTRRHIWKVYTSFLAYLKRSNSKTNEMIRFRAYELMMNGQSKEKKFNYVLIDEAQDLSPVAIKLCFELCESPAGIFLTADASQSIYNRSFSWNKVHSDLKVRGRTRILRRNYRTTREIATAANQILLGSKAGDKETLDQFFVHSGPKPQCFPARDEDEMLYWIYQSISKAKHSLKLPNSAVAVLSTTNRSARRLANQLTSLGLPTEYMTGKNLDLERDCAKSLVIHSAKGLEFPILAIPYLEEGTLPNIEDVSSEDSDIAEEIALQARLFYVGCSRAMRRLFVSYRQDFKSRFLEDLTYWSQSNL